MKSIIIFLNITFLIIVITGRISILHGLEHFSTNFEIVYIIYAITAFLNLLNVWHSANQRDFLKPFQVKQITIIANAVCLFSYILIIIFNTYYYQSFDLVTGTIDCYKRYPLDFVGSYLETFRYGYSWWLHLSALTSLLSLLSLISLHSNKSKSPSNALIETNRVKKPQETITEDGLTIETAIKLPPVNTSDGIGEIYRILSQKYGQINKDWTLVSQKSMNSNNRRYDEMRIQLANGREISVFFDKTDLKSEF